jgi:hypothetical protein
MQDDLTALREAAARRDWNDLQNALTRLFMGLDLYVVIELVVRRMGDYLPTFEAANPGADWARRLLVSVTSYGVAPGELPPEAGEPHPTPGAANFIMALLDLCRGLERKTPLENRIRFLANAVSNTILAELAAAWYGEHPDAWAEQQEHGEEIDSAAGVSVRQRIYAGFWLDDATAARDTAAWLQVADAVEKAISRR